MDGKQWKSDELSHNKMSQSDIQFANVCSSSPFLQNITYLTLYWKQTTTKIKTEVNWYILMQIHVHSVIFLKLDIGTN